MTAPPKRQPIPFGKYLLLDRVNIGGMAEVWRGKMFGAGGFERLVAIKRILPSIAEDEEFITMFIDEAKITVQLTHANIAQVYDLGQIANSYYIAMEYVPGKDLRAIFDRCRKKGEPAPVPLTCFVVAKMCEGLDYAHRKKDSMGRDMNIVHRDVSPQNVLVSYEGEVKVIDFGIAKAAGKATKTQAGILKGKFAYMSPEQIRGLPLDRRSDIFAIGICLYEMLTGERLFVGDSDFSVLEKVRKAEVLPPSTYNRKVPEPLEKIVLKALAKDVEDRYQYASELADDLQRFLITQESIFSRKDLMQYMKSTFAEEVEREKLRLQEYAEIKPSEGMRAAIEMGMGGLPGAGAPAAAPAPIQLTSPQPAASGPRASATGLPAVNPGGPPVLTPSAPPAEPRRSPSLAAMPKLTAAAPMLTNAEDDEGGATVLVDGSEYFKDEGTPAPTTPQLTAQPAVPLDAESPPTAIIGPPAGVEQAPAEAPAATGPVPQIAVSTVILPPRVSKTPEGARPTPPHSPSPTAAPARRASRTHTAQATGRVIAETAPTEDFEEEQAAPTSPARPKFENPDAPRMVAGVSVRVLGVVAMALVLVLIGVGVVLFRGPGEGMLYIEVPAGMVGKARVNINGRDLGDPAAIQWPLFERVEAGPTAVMITAEGWETFTGSVEVREGREVTRLVPEIQPKQAFTKLFVVLEPAEAEIRVDGRVVKEAGEKVTPFMSELAVGKTSEVEIRLAGHETFTRMVTAKSATDPVTLTAKLEPLKYPLTVTSEPPGAYVYVDGREMGETPANLIVPGGTTGVTLKKRCFEDLVVPVKLPAEPGSAIPVRGRLKKQPGCR